MSLNATRFSLRKSLFYFFAVLISAGCLNSLQVSAQTVLISPTGDGGFENGSTFAANGWTEVNGATNQWFVGNVATPSAGNNSAYISDNASGTTYNYNNGSSSTVHFYRDVTFPAGETNIVLSFKWKAGGESTWDYVTVYSMPTSVTPVVNLPTPSSSSWTTIPTVYSGAVVHANPQGLNLQSTYQTQTICLPASYAGTTRRLVFMWLNDGSGGTQPPASVDEISLVTSASTAPANSPTSLALTAFPSTINGSFSAATGGSESYLVVRYPAGATPVSPVNGTFYTAGTPLGTGRVVSAGPGTTFSAIGLTPSTSYDFYVYSYNSASCFSGPLYKTSSPLFGSQGTTACGGGPTGTFSVGPTGTYGTLTAAIAATLPGISGNVIFELQPTYTGSGETFPITFPGNGCFNTSRTVTVRPQTGASGLSISSANSTATIDFNGATYITIDGRPGGTGTTSQLAISNTATGSAVAVRFINDAANNTITYCTLAASTTSLGVVSFGTGNVTGNDNNTISNNNIGPAGTNLPLNGIYSLGTSAAIDNSANTVTANNIFDVFSATSAFNALNINTGNSGWTINNNKIYQTATRTVTTGNLDNGIFIASGNGYTINNNVIGYASSAATGIMTLNSAAALRYTAINAGFATGAPVSNIHGNTIAAITVTTSGATTTANGNLCGINVASGDVNIGTVDGNTIGATSGTGSLNLTSTTTGSLLVGINTSSLGNVSIQNNTMGAWNNSSATAAIAGSITGINVSGVASSMNISNNIIGNATTDNLQGGINVTTTGSSLVSGINLSSTPYNTVAVANNTIRNLSSYGTGTSGFVRGIWTGAATGSSTVYNITGNVISNLVTNAPNTAIANGQSSAVGIALAVGNNSLISQNIILNITNTNTGTTQFYVAGIIHGNATNTVISRNRIYGLANAGTSTTTTAPDIAAGIIIRSGFGAVTMTNNMISLGNGQATNTAFVGIQCNNGSTPDPNNNIYFNSINIEGTVTTGAQPSFGIARTDFNTTARTVPMVVKNNIITNSRSGGTGKHYAIANNYGATATATGWAAGASDYNVLNAAAATIGYWTSDQTFAGWKAASIGDANSLSGITVSYVNTPTGDLHLAFSTTPTPIESGGVSGTGITTDYDNQVRPGPTGSTNGGGCAPDLGADEFDGVPLDLAGPVIQYTALGNSSCASRVFSPVSITDCSGVNVTTGTRPRLYYKKSTDANTYAGNTSSDNGWKYVEASNTSSPFSFSINYALLQSAVAAGDVIQYFVVAQDLASTPSVNISSGVFAAAPSSVALTSGAFPVTGSVNSYTIVTAGPGGTVTIGAAGTYTSLTGATGLFNAINTQGLTSNLTANIIDASVTETGAITLNAINNTGCATGSFTLLIKPAASVTATLTGSVASGALIKLNGVSDVTIDGSNSGGTSRNLTIENTNTTAPTAIALSSPGVGLGVKNTTIKNTAITTGISTGSLSFGISIGGSTPGTIGADNDNVTIQNNSITVASIGIFAGGTNAVSTGGDDNLIITGNTIDYNGVLAGIGIQAGAAVNSSISQNVVSEQTSSTQAPTGISLETGFVSSTVTRNNITKALTTNTGGYGGRGITVGTGVANSNLIISNNFITGINGSNWSGFSNSSSMGIAIGTLNSSSTITTITDGVALYNNTVSMTGTMGTGSSSNITTALYIGSGASGLDIRNNIFSNTQVATSTTQKNYAIYSAGANTAFTAINNNDYYVANSFNAASAILGFLGSDRANLAAWQSASGQDAQSVSVNPVFVSATDLHLDNTLGTNWCLNNSGAIIPSVTVDIDLQARGTPPDIGADEFAAVDNTAATPSTQVICSGSAITTIALSGVATSFSWTRDNTAAVTGIAAGGTGNISGSLTNTTTAPVTVTYTITPLNANGCPFGSTITATVVVNPRPDAAALPSSQAICSGSAITTIVNSGSVTGTVFNWTRDNVSSVTGIAAGGAGNISGTLTNTTVVSVPVTFTITPSYTNAGVTCTGTAVTAPVTVNATNTITLTSAVGTDAQSICATAPITNITYATTGATGATVTGLPAGVSGSWAANVVTISGAPAVAGTYTYTITLTGGCGSTTATGTISVTTANTLSLTSAAGTTAQTACINTALTNITYTTTGATGATVTGLPPGVTGIWAANTVTISGTPTAAGGFSYTVTLTGGCGALVTATGSVTVTPNKTITLSSAAGTIAQAVCINTAITNITYATTGATGATFSGLPAGVSGSWAANVATISGTPTVSGTFSYTVTTTGGCGTATATGSITVNPNNAISLTSAAGSNVQTICISTPITNITYATVGVTGATFSGLPAGVSGVWAGNVVTISGSPSVSGTFSYTVTLTGGAGCGGTVTATGTITVTPNNTSTLTSGAGTTAQAVCINNAITNITYATTTATGATFSGLPTGVSGSWAGNVATISGTPTVAGTFSYTVTLTGGCSSVTSTGSITVNPNNAATLTSGAGSNVQTICISTPITNITYATVGVTGATFSGLPAGVSGVWAGNVVTISGSPTASGTFSYTVTLTGGAGCGGTATATGTITVTPNNTVTLTSAAGTNAQSKCINTAITNITYATTGATGATFSGLPTGVSGSWAGNVATISGTPTVAGTFSYTVTLTGGCSTVTATGSITVAPNGTITLLSAAGTTAQTLCINNAITNINYVTTNATGATFSGLPTGVVGIWSGNVVSIVGTPTVSGTFNYTVTPTIGCGTVTATGTIIVRPDNTITLTSAAATTAQTRCLNLAITNITYATTGATGATVTGLPTGVSSSFAGNVVTISGTPTVSGTFSYVITLTGGCATVTATGTITVNPLPVVSIGPASAVICTGSSITLTASGASTYVWSPAGSLSASTGTSVVANPTTTATYNITGTDANGCISTVSKVVTVNLLPTITTTASGPTTICQGLSVTLNAFGGVSYSWSPATGLSSTTGSTVTASPSSTTTYTITGTNANGCVNTATRTITVLTAPNAAITPGDVNVCKDDTVYFTATPGYASYVWMLYGVPVQTGTSNTYQTFTGGFYTLKVTNSIGCSTTTSVPSVVTVTQRPVPVITQAGANLDAGAGFASYQWYAGGAVISGATGRAYTPTAGGSYTVVVTDTTALHCSGKSEPYIFTGVGVNGNNAADVITLYPNPANDVVFIKASVPVNVTVHSMEGKLLFSGNDVREINIGTYADGMYRVLITDKHGAYLKAVKITKMTK